MKTILFCFYLFLPCLVFSQTKIITAEKFISTDPGVGNGIHIAIVSPADSTTIINSIITNTLAPGFYPIGYRFLDEQGRWSLTQYELIQVKNIAPLQYNKNITKGEYFIDTDPGNGNGTNINLTSIGDSTTITAAIVTTNLSVGFHSLGFRFRDIAGGWSLTNYELIQVKNQNLGQANQDIVKAEVFINSDPGIGLATPISISSPADSVTISQLIKSAFINPGTYKYGYRFRDVSGRWSLTQFDTIKITAANSITTYSLDTFQFCVGATVPVKFHLTGSYDANNEFTAQLSDAAGSFSNPIDIGSINSKDSLPISAIIPINVPQGSHYRIRVISNHPITTGTDNGNDFIINSVTPAVSISANPGFIVAPGTMVTFTATPINGGTSPSYQWKKNQVNVGSNSTNYIDDVLEDGDVISCVMTSNAQCLNTPIATNTITMVVGNLNDYRTIGSGIWDDTSSGVWQRFNGNSWQPSQFFGPNATANTITVRHFIQVTSRVFTTFTVDQLKINPGGYLQINTDVTFNIVDGPGTDMLVEGAVVSAGTIGGNGTIDFASGSQFDWLFGTMNGNGITNFQSGSDIRLDTTLIGNPGSNKTIGGTRTINNYGTINWSSGFITMSGGGATFNNNGVINLTAHARDFSFTFGNQSSFNNNVGGIINKLSNNSQDINHNWNFQNHGTIHIEQGTLSVYRFSLQDGLVDVSSNATMEFIGGNTPTINTANAVYTGTGNINLNLNQNFTINSPLVLNFNTNKVNLIQSGVNLSVTGIVNFNNGSTLNFNSGRMSGGGIVNFNVGSTINWSAPGSSLGLTSITINNNSTINWSAGQLSMQFGGGNIINNNSLINISESAGDLPFFFGTVSTINNNIGATINKTSNNTQFFQNNWNFINHGTINILNGNLVCGNFSLQDGLVKIAEGLYLELSGSLTNHTPNANYTGTGSINLTVNAQFIVNNPVNLSINSNTMNLNNALLTGTGVINFNNGSTFNWINAFLTGTGITNFNPGSIINWSSSNTKVLVQRTINNYSTINWTGGAMTFQGGNGGIINNNGTWNFNGSAGDFPFLFGIPAVINNNEGGTINKNTTADQFMNNNWQFNNAGVLNINANSLDIENFGSTQTGIYNIANGSNLTGAALNYTGTSISNNGNITLSGFNIVGTSIVNLNGNGNITNLRLNGSGGMILEGNQRINTSMVFSNGKLTLGNNDLILGNNATLSGGNANSYCIATSNGALQQKVSNTQTDVLFPVGTNTSYLPAKVQLTTGSTTDSFRVRIQGNIFESYDANENPTSAAVDGNLVNGSWLIKEMTAGGSNAIITLQWNATDETAGFNRSVARFGHYTSDSWNLGNITAASGSNPFTLTRSGITSFSPFAILGQFITSPGNYGPFCSGESFSLPYTAVGNFAGGNKFTAQLSDASGNFATPVIIGSLNTTTSGIISCNTSSLTPAGVGYRVRVVSTNPITNGNDNGRNIIFNASPLWFEDKDGDGLGNAARRLFNCSQPIGYVSDSTDCDDNNNLVLGPQIYYHDLDGDGFGDATQSLIGCTQPIGYVSDHTDCDDSKFLLHNYFTPTVDITTTENNFCSGTQITLNASASFDAAATIHYQWINNGVFAGTDNKEFSYQPANNDVVTCRISFNNTCATINPLESNSIQFIVHPMLTPTLSVTSGTGNKACNNEKVVFTANQTNGGASPTYQWFFNNTPIGSNSDTFSRKNLAYSDSISCIMTTSALCSVKDTAIGYFVHMMTFLTLNPIAHIEVKYPSPHCFGDDIQFFVESADPSDIAHYQWFLNNHPIGSDTSAFVSHTIQNGDTIRCQLISNYPCLSKPIAISNNIVAKVPNFIWYRDHDHDLFGDPNVDTIACEKPVGYVANNTDCDDNNVNIYPRPIYPDRDGDGFGTFVPSPNIICASVPPPGFSFQDIDCNDFDNTVWFGVQLYRDEDGDGYNTGKEFHCFGNTIPTGFSLTTRSETIFDCDDHNSNKFIAQQLFHDEDGDGFTVGSEVVCRGETIPIGYSDKQSSSPDCNDHDKNVFIFQQLFFDVDGDGFTVGSEAVCRGTEIPPGYSATQSSSPDCNDHDSNVFILQELYHDVDGDGFTVGSQLVCRGVDVPSGFSSTQSSSPDCNDNDPNVFVFQELFNDADEDGFTLGSQYICRGPILPKGFTDRRSADADCNDHNNAIHGPTTFYRDSDGDGFGDPTIKTISCTQPVGYVLDNTDCNDGNSNINPSASEIACNGIDDDCDNLIDEVGATQVFFADNDGDGYGNALVHTTSCIQPVGYVNNNSDCNDSNVNVNPSAPEIPCNGIDDNCDGVIDENGILQTWFADQDGDGFGNSAEFQLLCAPMGIYNASVGGDCDDTDNTKWHMELLFIDKDGDGYDNGKVSICYGTTIPNGYSLISLGSDCDDNNATIHPNATEICGNNLDDNCNGEIDESCCKAPNFTYFSANITIQNDPGHCYAIVNYPPAIASGTDPVVSYSKASGSSFDIGTTTVFVYANNSCGWASCSFTIMVADIESPIATCKNSTVGLDANGLASISADQVDNGSSDNCGILSKQIVPSSFTCNQKGTNSVMLIVTDANGHSANCNATVTVLDNLAPSAICKNSKIKLIGGNGSITIDSVNNGSTDNCGILSKTISKSNFNCSNAGTNNVVLTITDISGNASTCNSIITVTESIAPVAKCKSATIYLNASGIGSLAPDQMDNGSSDNCGITIKTVSQNAFSCSDQGNPSIVFTVTDGSGNSDSCTKTVTVIDSIKPKAFCKNITIPLDKNGNLTLIADQLDNGSTDNCGIVSKKMKPKNFNCSDIGINYVELTVSDKSGNSSSCKSIVTIIDNIVPVTICKDLSISLSKDGTKTITANQIDSATKDNCSILNLSLSKNSFNCSNIGKNTIILTATDNYLNSSTCSAIVTINDNLKPTMKCKNISINLNASGSANINALNVDDGSSDNCGLSKLTVNPNSFSCGNNAIYTVILKGTDPSGNIDSCSAKVTVKDTILPKISCPNSVNANTIDGACNLSKGLINLGAPTTSDNCTIANILNNVPNTYEAGPTIVKWTATDASGNSNSCNQIVNVTLSSCGLPLNVTVKDIKSNAATIDWNTGYCDNYYQIRIQSQISQGIWSSFSNWDSTIKMNYKFGNLSSNTIYNFEIKSQCTGKNSISVSGIFTTKLNLNDPQNRNHLTLLPTNNLPVMILVKPNPAREFADLLIQGFETTEKEVDLFDLFGKIIFSVKIPADLNGLHLDLTALNVTSGIYLLKIFDTSHQKTEKLMIEK